MMTTQLCRQFKIPFQPTPYRISTRAGRTTSAGAWQVEANRKHSSFGASPTALGMVTMAGKRCHVL